MILPIKPVCKKEWVRRDGTSVIFLQYCFNSDERVLVDSGLAIPPEFWNKKNNRISTSLPDEFGKVKELELDLSEKMRRAEDLINHALSNSNVHPTKFLKQNFHTDFDPKKSTVVLNATNTLDVFWHLDNYKESKRPTVKRCTINVINTMKNHLLSFQTYRRKKITFDSFDLDFYEEFLNYLIYEIPHLRRKTVIKGLKLNTVGK